MEKKQLVEYASQVAHTLKDELPKGGMSLMLTSDGEGAVVCHMMGRPDKLVEILATTMYNNEQLYDCFKLAFTAADLMRDLKKEFKGKMEVKDLSKEDENEKSDKV